MINTNSIYSAKIIFILLLEIIILYMRFFVIQVLKLNLQLIFIIN